MAQNGNIFTAFWMDTTSAPGTPLTGLSATINIRDMSGNLVVNDASMTEIGGGHYIYTFTGYNPALDYVYDCNPGATAYRESGVTNNLQQLISEIRGGGGGFSINYGTINTHTTNKMRELRDEFLKSTAQIEKGFNDTNSHIDIAKGEITDKIESIEIPKTDLSDLNKSIGIARQQLTKLSEYLRKEAESEKKEMEKEYEGKISELETTIDGIEAMFEEFKGMSEEEKKTLLESKENELKEITEFADEAIEYYKEQKDSAKTEGQEEIKSKLKSLL